MFQNINLQEKYDALLGKSYISLYNLIYTKYNAGFITVILRNLWLPSPELIITPDLGSIVSAFQDLRYIGELRQRWNEIKKLHNSTSFTTI